MIEVGPVGADVPSRESHVASQSPLEIEAPLLHIAVLEWVLEPSGSRNATRCGLAPEGIRDIDIRLAGIVRLEVKRDQKRWTERRSEVDVKQFLIPENPIAGAYDCLCDRRISETETRGELFLRYIVEVLLLRRSNPDISGHAGIECPQVIVLVDHRAVVFPAETEVQS